MTQTARGQAIARLDDAIASNVAKIEAAKRPPNALELIAARLNISPQSLSKTLRATVFAKANDDEFAALMVVANSYNLNPLTKEIYAFPSKGGGIVPIVSIDGWIRIANEHAQMDGFSQDDVADENGKLIAVTTTMWRKDRTRPIVITRYLDECMMQTDPWKKQPALMLGHKSFITCARYAFGFSGIYDEGDGSLIGDIQLTSEPVPMRPAQRIEQQPEVEQVSAEEEERIARDLDANFDPHTGEIIEGDHHDDADVHPAQAKALSICADVAACTTIIDLTKLETACAVDVNSMPDEYADGVQKAFIARRAELKGQS